MVQNVLNMLETLSKWVDEIPPIQQPQRFGNKAFRDWFARVKQVLKVYFRVIKSLIQTNFH